MPNSVQQDKFGPDWPLGLIVVAAAGTPVAITSLIDPSGVNNPNTPTPGTSGADEYTENAQQILFQAFKAGAGPPALIPNIGNIYIVRKPTGGNSGTPSTDKGVIVATLTPGQTFTLSSSAMTKNVFNLYRYLIDADNNGDSCLVTAVMQ